MEEDAEPPVAGKTVADVDTQCNHALRIWFAEVKRKRKAAKQRGAGMQSASRLDPA